MKILIIGEVIPSEIVEAVITKTLAVKDAAVDIVEGDYDRIELDVTDYPEIEVEGVIDWLTGYFDGKPYKIRRLTCRCDEQKPCILEEIQEGAT